MGLRLGTPPAKRSALPPNRPDLAPYVLESFSSAIRGDEGTSSRCSILEIQSNERLVAAMRSRYVSELSRALEDGKAPIDDAIPQELGSHMIQASPSDFSCKLFVGEHSF